MVGIGVVSPGPKTPLAAMLYPAIGKRNGPYACWAR